MRCEQFDAIDAPDVCVQFVCGAQPVFDRYITAMTPMAGPKAEGPAISIVAGTFVLLAVAAWFASLPGVSVATVYYGALLVSERMYRQFRAPTTRLQRSLGLVGLTLAWIIALAFSAAVLPSNFSAALI